MITYSSFDERLNYLLLDGIVGDPTFGSRRYLNQSFYTSSEWKSIRDQIILRDLGCDLALEDYPIFGRIYVHHINPLSEKDLLHDSLLIGDPDNLICVSFDTHNAIHYGNANTIFPSLTDRTPNDTCPWKVT